MEFEQPQEDSVSLSGHLNVRLPCRKWCQSQKLSLLFVIISIDANG
jgi:hypothetical protein